MVTQAAARTPKKPKPTGAVLQLTTGAEEKIGHVAIDGVAYEMRNPTHFGLSEGGKIWRSISRIAELDALAEMREPTTEENDEYRARMLAVAGAALPEAPSEKLAQVPTGALSDLVVHFFGEVAKTNPRVRMILAKRPTGTT